MQPLNPIALTLGPVVIHWYAVWILSGAIIAFSLAVREGKKYDLPKDILVDLFLYGLPLSILGARLYYVLFNIEFYAANPSKILAFQDGGLAIHGGLITAFIFGFTYTIFVRKYRYPLLIADIAALFIPIGQIFGRVGNFFNQEAYGPITSREYLTNTLHLPDFIVNQMYICSSNPTNYCPVGVGNYFIPTFLYEMIWNTIGFAIMYFVIRKSKSRYIGEMMLFYFVWYSIGRAFIETLRQDALLIPGTSISIAISISVVIIVVCLIIFLIRRKYKIYLTTEHSLQVK